MSSVRQSVATLTGGIDRVLPGDSRRWSLLASNPGTGNYFIGPLESMLSSGGGISCTPNIPFVISYDRFGELLTNDWYATGPVGLKVTLTELLGP